jgi:hypothetical protein
MIVHKLLCLLPLLALLAACENPKTLVEKADGAIIGKVLPGEAAGYRGKIYVTATSTNQLDKIDWSRQRDVLSQFGDYEITDLVAGKYFIAAYLDVNGSSVPDAGDYWGGYESNGDGLLDAVTLIGGKALVVDIAFLKRIE